MAEPLTVLGYACPVDEVRERLARLMKPRFANVEELAKASGVSATVLRYFLKGVTKELKFADAVRVAEALEVSPEQLAFGDRRLESKRRVSALLESGDRLPSSSPAIDVDKLARQVERLVGVTRRLSARLKALEAPTGSRRGSRRRGQPPA